MSQLCGCDDRVTAEALLIAYRVNLGRRPKHLQLQGFASTAVGISIMSESSKRFYEGLSPTLLVSSKNFELKPPSMPASSFGDSKQELHYGWSALLVVLADLAAWAESDDPTDSQSPLRASREHCTGPRPSTKRNPFQVETFCYLWKLLSLRWWKSFTIGILLPLGFPLQEPCECTCSGFLSW